MRYHCLERHIQTQVIHFAQNDVGILGNQKVGDFITSNGCCDNSLWYIKINELYDVYD